MKIRVSTLHIWRHGYSKRGGSSRDIIKLSFSIIMARAWSILTTSDPGFSSGKSMSLYSREGHLGIHVVKFSGDESGLKEAMRLSHYFEWEKRGRTMWVCVHPGKDDDENNLNLVKLDS